MLAVPKSLDFRFVLFANAVKRGELLSFFAEHRFGDDGVAAIDPFRKTGRDPSLALRMTAGLLKVRSGTAHYEPIGSCILQSQRRPHPARLAGDSRLQLPRGES